MFEERSTCLFVSLPSLLCLLVSKKEMNFDSSGKGPSQLFGMELPSQGPGDEPDELSKLGEPMMMGGNMMEGDEEDSSQFSMSPREQHDQDADLCLKMFEGWTGGRQTEFVEQLIDKMSFHQHEHIYSILMPMLQRDFITVLPSESTCSHCMP